MDLKYNILNFLQCYLFIKSFVIFEKNQIKMITKSDSDLQLIHFCDSSSLQQQVLYHPTPLFQEWSKDGTVFTFTSHNHITNNINTLKSRGLDLKLCKVTHTISAFLFFAPTANTCLGVVKIRLISVLDNILRLNLSKFLSIALRASKNNKYILILCDLLFTPDKPWLFLYCDDS